MNAGTRYPQVKSLKTPAALRARLDELGLDLPVDDEVDPEGPLAQPVEVGDRDTTFVAPNRFAILPMEGWDGTTDGHPTDLVRRRWRRFGESGCGLVWGEATAVRPDGRANPRQLVLSEATVGGFAELRRLLAPDQVAGLQLTHSGRWSRPDGRPAPRTAYRHPVLDRRAAGEPFTDEELDQLADDYVAAAVLAQQAGFDFVDIKHCHGYLLHELLSAYDRPGRYGGGYLAGITFLHEVIQGVRRRAPGLAVAMRLSAFDLAPFVADNDAGGIGVPEVIGPYPWAFGGDGTGRGIDLGETFLSLHAIGILGVRTVSVTGGSPYYNPHVQRPAWFPPSDGYQPPEDPLVGVARLLHAAAECTNTPRRLTVVGSGYSYLQEWLPHVAQASVAAGRTAMVGLGRMALSYPTLAADVLAGRPLDRRLVCRTFSDCTTAPRNGLVSGCYPLDPFYKAHPDRPVLARIKRGTRSAGRAGRPPGPTTDVAEPDREAHGEGPPDGPDRTGGPPGRTPDRADGQGGEGDDG